MNRDACRQSKVEKVFADKLRSAGLNVEESKWFNFAEKLGVQTSGFLMKKSLLNLTEHIGTG